MMMEPARPDPRPSAHPPTRPPAASMLRNPWLGALLALAAVGLQAWLDSPRAALAIGLPLAIACWLGWCLGPRMAGTGGLMAMPPRQVFAGSLAGIAVLALMAGWFAWMTYGLVTERGVIGWLNAVQAARDGRFSTKFSFIVALVYLIDAMALMGLVVSWLAPGRQPGAMAATARVAATHPAPGTAPRAPGPAQDRTRLALGLLAALAVGAWVVGYPAYRWVAAQHREDAAAHYVSVTLDAAVVWPDTTHVALDAHPLLDEVLVLREGNRTRRTFFVPLTGRNWRRDQPVPAVLTFEAEAPPQLEHPVLGRLRSDTLPRAAVEAFARSGVTIEREHRLVELIPSQAGRVNDRSEEDRIAFLMLAGLVSGTSALAALMLGLVRLFKRRAAR